MQDLTLQHIYVYPIKSLGGISLQQAEVDRTGLKHDRRWLLVDDYGTFLTQRTLPVMALLQVSLTGTGLQVADKRGVLPPLYISFSDTTSTLIEATVFDDTCTAAIVGGPAAEWFSSALKTNVRLVYMPDNTARLVEQPYAKHQETVSFADGYPFLVISQSSLDDLNSRLSAPVPMNRFRPNFVIGGGTPYCEDQLQKFSIGTVNFFGVKRCGRCVMTTVDQQTAEKGKEPLRTLAAYRTINNKVLFGQNLLHTGNGTVRIGDPLVVRQTV